MSEGAFGFSDLRKPKRQSGLRVVGSFIDYGEIVIDRAYSSESPTRANIRAGLDATEVILSGTVSTFLGVVAAWGAGSATAASVAGIPAAPVLAWTAGTTTAVMTDNAIDDWWKQSSLRDQAINGLENLTYRAAQLIEK